MSGKPLTNVPCLQPKKFTLHSKAKSSPYKNHGSDETQTQKLLIL